VATLTIDEHEAQRLFALIFRDELKLQPARANELAETFCRPIAATMPERERSWVVSNWRAIQEYPKRNPELVAEMRRYVPQVDQEVANDLWRAIYQFARDLPVEVMARLTAEDRAPM
jgi:hypothetical protein